MATLNQLQPIEGLLTVDEANWFRTNAPHFLDALRLQQTVINQLIIRVGGPGGGGSVVNLDELTDSVDQLENQDQEAIVASLSGRISHLEMLVRDMQSDYSSDTRSIDAIEDLRREAPIDRYNELLSRIEALEAQL